MIGETVSRYRILERLGSGGMGEVYLAEDMRLHRRVALKMLTSGARSDPEAESRLLQEARAASALSHPGIAVVYEIDEAPVNGTVVRFIAMEYVAGATLAELARSGDLDADRILDLVQQVAEALADAHARGIVHRDIKPSNIIVTEQGRAKVLDFGLASGHVLPQETDSTWTRDPGREPEAAGLVGTLAYMAPEQALGQDVDGRADVFSLGALMWELLAGQPPFTEANAARTLNALLHRDPPPLQTRFDDPRIPQIEAIARRMLAKDREARYPGMPEVVDDLRAVRQGARPKAMAEPGPPRVAVATFANITRNGEDDWLGTGIAETITADLRSIDGISVITPARIQDMLRRQGVKEAEPDEGLAIRASRELGARWLVSGGFQRAGQMVRVTALLLDVAKGTVVQTLKLDGRLAEIFELQDRIVRELGSGLRMTLEPGRPAHEETQVIEAYEAFSRGVLNLRRETYESLDRAAVLFEQAVALDPAYARAHLELGSAYFNKGDYLAIPAFYDRALASYRRALELQPDLLRAWHEMGRVLVSLGRDDEGIAAIRHALELDPEDAGAMGSLGRALFVGRAEFAEAAAQYERALARNPQAGWWALQLSHCLALLRDFERGEAMANRAAELQAAFVSGQQGIVIVGAFMRLGHFAALQGRHAQAIEQFQRELQFVQRVDHALRERITIELNMRLGQSLLRVDRRAEASEALDLALRGFEERIRLGADDPFTRYYAAGAHALRGETEEALVGLGKAARTRRAFTVARARIEPEFEGLRQEPRFRELVGLA